MTVRTLNAGEAAPGAPRARPLSLRRNFSWTLAGSAVASACQWAMLVVLAKLGTPAVVGRFSLALAITAPPILLATLNMRTIQATDARERYALGHYVALRLAALTLASAGLLVCLCLSRAPLMFAAILLGVAVAKIFDALSDVAYGFLQQRERMDRIAFSRILQSSLQIAALGGVYWLTRSLVLAVAAYAAASAAVTALYDIPSVLWASGHQPPRLAAIRPRWERSALAGLARLSLPLGVVAVLGSLSMAIPRYFIAHDLGERNLGFFSAIVYSVSAAGMVQAALQQSAMPRLSVAYQEDRREFVRLLQRLMAAALANGVVALLIAALCGGKLMAALFKPEYASHPWVLLWSTVYLTVFVASSVLTAGLSAARQFDTQPLVILAQVAATALGCLWLVPRLGLLGAVFGMIIGFAPCLVCFGLLLTRAIAAPVGIGSRAVG